MTAIYQLEGGKWVLLQSPVDEDSPSKTFAALLKHLPKGVGRPKRWREDANRLICKVREWPDAKTAMLYIYAAGSTSGGGNSPSRFLLTLKFDAEGNSRPKGTGRLRRPGETWQGGPKLIGNCFFALGEPGVVFWVAARF